MRNDERRDRILIETTVAQFFCFEITNLKFAILLPIFCFHLFAPHFLAVEN